MDRLDAMTLFVAAVDEGSLAAAGRRHGRSPATVTRAVALLEDHAEETLLLRSTRRLSLTAAGERHVAIWREVLAKLGEIVPVGESGALQGNIALTAPELFGRLNVMPVLEPFLREHPQVRARALLVNRIVDLVGEGVDLAIRLASLPDSTMTAIKLGESRLLICAAPEYLARAGEPDSPRALEGHACIGFNAEDEELWPLRSAKEAGAPIRSIRVSTRLSVSTAAAAVDAARRGNGLVRARSYQVVDDIAAGRLIPVLRAFEPPPEPAHLLFHPERGQDRAVRAFIDYAVPRLRSELRRTGQ